MANVLVIDDDEMMCKCLCDIVQRLGHCAMKAHSIGEGLFKAQSVDFDVVFLDVCLPDGSGLKILPVIHESTSLPEVIIITGAGDPDGAELAIRSGAWDYIQKGSSLESIRLSLARALQFREQKQAKSRPNSEAKGVVALKRKDIVGNSPKMRASLDLVAQAANSDASILIAGETGTGKELFARAIHENSSRAKNPFVVVDCAALTETLVENMLFGHERGAFTGADRTQEGMLKQADTGTLVLDEVGELPLNLQKSFLRVLQERRFRPLGAKQEMASNFRLITATNRNLDGMVREGQFRKDLYYRIRSFLIDLPPLRERDEDIRDLALYHMARHCKRYGLGTKGLSPEFIDALSLYDWPGNVRELVHCMENAVLASESEPTLFPDHLPVHIRSQVVRAHIARAIKDQPYSVDSSAQLSNELASLRHVRDEGLRNIEKNYLRRLLSIAGTNINEACRISGLSRSQLYTLLKKHGLSRKR